jgi:hypothetical protein
MATEAWPESLRVRDTTACQPALVLLAKSRMREQERVRGPHPFPGRVEPGQVEEVCARP